MSAPLLVIAAGGTGGHMFPAQALSEAMLKAGWRVKLSTDDRGARYAGGFPEAVAREVIPSATFARGGLVAKLAVPMRLLAGVLAAVRAMRQDRPLVVAGFGGYPSFPAITAAWLLRLPRMIHEQNGVLGRVNRLFARRVGVVACGTDPTELPSGTRAIYTGNPVRTAVLDAVVPYEMPGTGPLRVVAIGGSQGARILADTVAPALAALPEALRSRLEISQQARPEDVDRVRAAYQEMGVTADIETFFTDVPKRLAQAQLVISRAGASSVADITVIGRPAVLVPFAAATADHQTANARGLREAGGAVVILERDLTAERLSDAVAGILGDPARAAEMAQAASGLGRPDATERLVAVVAALAKGTDPTKGDRV